MGYSTDFYGEFTLNKKLDEKLHAYLKKFSESRRMKRDITKLPSLITDKRLAEYNNLFGGSGQSLSFFDYNSH